MITYSVGKISNIYVVLKDADGVRTVVSGSFKTREQAEAKKKEIIWSPKKKLPDYMST